MTSSVRKEKEKCRYCEGSRKCNHCMGVGLVKLPLSGFGPPKPGEDCIMCGGSGRCPHCDGTGYE